MAKSPLGKQRKQKQHQLNNFQCKSQSRFVKLQLHARSCLNTKQQSQHLPKLNLNINMITPASP